MIGLLRRLRARVRYRRFDNDLAEEMAFHQTLKEHALTRDGLSAADARDAARREMGNVTLAREASRGIWIASWLDSVWQDVCYAARNLRRQPAFTLAAFAALLLGIGLNTSAFTLFNAIALRPWPVHEPGRVVRIFDRGPGPNGRIQGVGGFGLAEYRYLREHTRTFSGLIASRQTEARLGHEEAGQATPTDYVSDNYFDTLGVEMIVGRGFLPEEDVPASPRAVAVISHRLWTRLLSSDPGVLDRTLRIEEIPFTIVGVASPDFTGASETVRDLWLPLSALRLLQTDQAYAMNVLEKPDHCCSQMAGRLAPGVTREQARAELDVLSNRYHAQWKLDASGVVLAGTSFISHPGSQRRRVLPMVGLMSGTVLLVLLLACANVGNLLLARGLARRREIAIRLSLGASRARVVRQLMTEGMVLASLAGAAAIGVAYVLPAFFLKQISGQDFGYAIEPDLVALAFTAGVSVLACMLFALAPALRVTSSGAKKARGTAWPAAAAQPGRDLASRSGASGTGLRGVLLATQLGLSVMLLVGAGLLLRSVRYAQQHDPGFSIDNVTVATPTLPRQAYDEARTEAFFAALVSSLSEDGNLRVGVTALVPLGSATGWTDFRFSGEDKSRARQVRIQTVSPGYFDVLRIPLVAGRIFEPADDRGRILVNEAMARQYFAGDNPVGRTLVTGENSRWEIIGVVRDAYVSGLDRVHPLVFGQRASGHWARLLIRSVPGTGTGGGDVAARVKAVANRLDARVLIDAKPLATYRDRWIAPARVMATTAGIVSLLALALASVGVFGVFAFVVQERTREIGIRMAIGARAGQVVGLVLRSTSWATAGGVVLGLAGSLLVSRALDGYTDGVGRFDTVTFASVAAILAIAALVATYVPVRRATRVDPATALRCE